MGVSKVDFAGQTLVDLTGDSVTAEKLVAGETAHNAAGNPVSGTNPYEKTATDQTVAEQTDLIAQIASALAEKSFQVGHGLSLSSTNIADPSGIIYNKYIETTGVETAYDGWSISGYIPVAAGKKYAVSPLAAFKQIKYCEWCSSDKQHIRIMSDTDIGQEKIILFVCPDDARYARFSAETIDIEKLEAYELLRADSAAT